MLDPPPGVPGQDATPVVLAGPAWLEILSAEGRLLARTPIDLSAGTVLCRRPAALMPTGGIAWARIRQDGHTLARSVLLRLR